MCAGVRHGRNTPECGAKHTMKQHIHSEKSIKLLKHFFLRMNGKKRMNSAFVDETCHSENLSINAAVRCKEPQKSLSPRRWAAWLRDNPSTKKKKKQIGLLFLNQGLESDDLMKMRSLLRGSGINVKKIPLRLWSRSRSQNNLNRAPNPTQHKKMLVHGEALGFFSAADAEGASFCSADPFVAFAETSALYQHWINIIAFLASVSTTAPATTNHGAAVVFESATESKSSRSRSRSRRPSRGQEPVTAGTPHGVWARRYDWLHVAESLTAQNVSGSVVVEEFPGLQPQDVSSSFGSLFFAADFCSPEYDNNAAVSIKEHSYASPLRLFGRASPPAWDNVASGSQGSAHLCSADAENPAAATSLDAAKRAQLLAEKQNLINDGVLTVISLLKKNNLHYIGSIARKDGGSSPKVEQAPHTFLSDLENSQLYSPRTLQGNSRSAWKRLLASAGTFLFDFEFLSLSGPRLNSFVRL
uniref:Uncharacterized protein n=1 Tax=Marophrys sp. SRT127 TaxID=2488311 RepID=A0A455RHW2_9EUKA|nr:hypothetical protein [Marophrys sp. SRT127]